MTNSDRSATGAPTERDQVDRALAQWRDERPDLDPTGMDIVLRVLQLGSTFDERLKHVLEPTALVPFEFDVLSALRRAGTLSAKELCEAAQLSSGAMTHRLDRLEERRLVRRRSSARDRRSIDVSLTAAGRRLVDGVLGRRMEDAARCVEGLTSAERRRLSSLLRALSLSLEGSD